LVAGTPCQTKKKEKKKKGGVREREKHDPLRAELDSSIGEFFDFRRWRPGRGEGEKKKGFAEKALGTVRMRSVLAACPGKKKEKEGKTSEGREGLTGAKPCLSYIRSNFTPLRRPERKGKGKCTWEGGKMRRDLLFISLIFSDCSWWRMPKKEGGGVGGFFQFFGGGGYKERGQEGTVGIAVLFQWGKEERWGGEGKKRGTAKQDPTLRDTDRSKVEKKRGEKRPGQKRGEKRKRGEMGRQGAASAHASITVIWRSGNLIKKEKKEKRTL